MQFRKYTKDQFIQAVQESHSIRQVLLKLSVNPQGGNYRVAKNYIDKLNLDISHFTGQAHNKGKRYFKQPIEIYLSNSQPIQSYKLKNRLLQEGVFQSQCNRCQNTEWESLPIPLELDHIDGNHQNNSLENLQLLCPNCHALTPTYRGKNKRVT